ncbi:MAG: hypothetical protein WCX61_01375 [Candidatus Peribacteraceae bacterium]
METFPNHLQSLHHGESEPLVRKLGGSTTAQIEQSVDMLKHDPRKGTTATVLSAFRHNDCPLTGICSDLADRLANGDTENIERVTAGIGARIQTLLDTDNLLDGQPTPNLFLTLDEHLRRIHQGGQYSVEEQGSDRILETGNGRISLLGQGEIATTKLYDLLLSSRMKVFDIEGMEQFLHQCGDIAQQRDITHGMLAYLLQECREQRNTRILVPGYLPHTARSLGYSDVTAVETSIVLRNLHGSQTVCSIEKEFPILDKMGGRCVPRLSYQEAIERCSEGGSAPGVVHRDAIRLAQMEGIPIIVHNPTKPELGATLIHW